MTTTATTKALVRAITRQHLIEEVRFVQTAALGRPMSEAPILCTCGEVTTSGAWEQHRGLSTDAARKARYEREEAA